MKKHCPECKTKKPTTAFARLSKDTNKLQPYCNPCRRLRAKQSYNKHRKATIAAVVVRNKLMLKRFSIFKSTLQCQICSERESVCLDFHHKDPTRKNGIISEMVARVGWDTLMAEVNKCIVLCANCHRKVHANIIRCPVSSAD